MRKMIWFGVLLALSIIIYWYYFSSPTTFPTHEQLIEEMNQLQQNSSIREIQDTIFLDERHVFVPFISDQNDYGLSYWVWKKRKWTSASIVTTGGPSLWKIDSHDPTSYYFVWNIHPHDQLGSMDLYLMRDRGYVGSDEKEIYYPKVQLKKSLELHEKPYGVKELSDVWIAIIDSIIKLESEKQPSIFQHMFLDQLIYFGWVPFDDEGQKTYPERTVIGGGFSTGDVTIEFIQLMHEQDLEGHDEL